MKTKQQAGSARPARLPSTPHTRGLAWKIDRRATTRLRNQAACIIELPSGAGDGSMNLPVGEACFDALLDLFRHEGMLPGAVEGRSPAFFGMLLDTQSPKAGLWMPCVRKVDLISGGQQIGAVDGLPVCASDTGIVMSVRPATYLFADDLWVMTFVVPVG